MGRDHTRVSRADPKPFSAHGFLAEDSMHEAFDERRAWVAPSQYDRDRMRVSEPQIAQPLADIFGAPDFDERTALKTIDV